MRILCLLLCIGASALMAADWPTFMGPHGNGISNESIVDTFSKEGPKLVWSIEVGPGYSPISVVGDKGYMLDRVDDEKDVFRVISMKDGNELWRHEHPVAGRVGYNGSRGAPNVVGNHAFALGPFGDMYAFDLSAKKMIWTKNVREIYEAGPPRWGYSQTPLVYGDLVDEARPVRVPRADILDYAFVSRPLSELAPDERHPVNGRTYAGIWQAFDASEQPLERVEIDGLNAAG